MSNTRKLMNFVLKPMAMVKVLCLQIKRLGVSLKQNNPHPKILAIIKISALKITNLEG